MTPESVSTCDPVQILEGVRLQPRELGRGSFGVVVLGSFHGQAVAVKVMLTSGLDRSALRELLLAPSLVHPCLVMTYTSRCAELTHEFFDFLEGARNASGVTHDATQPRTLLPAPFISGDGFGDPDHHMRGCGLDPMFLLHQILHDLRATTGQMLVLTVQEYCSKNTLLNAISKGVFREGERWDGRVALRALLRTAAEVARGLWHLHDNSIIHGDIKPANILLASSGEDRRGFTAKLADFGLAHLLPNAANSVSTEAFGSVAYMAPESFNGKVSRSTDIYSFGVTLWQMLTGALPFRGMKPAQVMAGVQSGKLQLVWPDVPPMARRLVALGQRCVAHTPSERPSAGQLLEELTMTERDLRSLAPGAPPPQLSFGSAEQLCSSSGSSAVGAAAAAPYLVMPQPVAWQPLHAAAGGAAGPSAAPAWDPRVLPLAVPPGQHAPAVDGAAHGALRYT
ncbi:hypothetical protein HXX76_006705 [Chlamydomonas incerta]|uniref:Protein kinase domain-containing protein n=1 Tax=Chlamydomonas incerta TaxID=51695 RepID=A0A835TDU1_CHLIN|nr:hypothetical protein HXX76_006705 [Chlamydomonas incerta]|eukprot:KAG2436401.1 hypothetical protein HXX76_006705 [Chlamydomonas incerta]